MVFVFCETEEPTEVGCFDVVGCDPDVDVVVEVVLVDDGVLVVVVDDDVLATVPCFFVDGTV